MRKLLFALLCLLPLLSWADDFIIDETKSDIYFANGVLTDKKTAENNLDLIWEKVRIEQYGGDVVKMEKELTFDTAYNQTFGTIADFYEALMQKADESFGWEALYNVIKAALMLKDKIEVTLPNGKTVEMSGSLFDRFMQITHDADISTQVKSYRKSIRQGHKVIVIAHSQGNLFTNEAYQKMISSDDGRENDWLKKYFTRISIATPASVKYGGDTVVSFHNDPVAHLGSLAKIDNPNKAYLKNALGEIIEEDALSADFHAFTYYMGEKSVQGTGQIGSGYHAKVSTDIAKNIIMGFIKGAVDKHKEAPSQWEKEYETGVNTCDYKIFVKHIFDPNLNAMMYNKQVYPFAPTKKLYPVNHAYVKASFGGEEIQNLQKNKPQNCDNLRDCYLLKGTGEKIEKEPSQWHVVAEHDKGTCNWRIDVENNMTGQRIDDVYPFNLKGEVYILASGEAVMASCGGETLLDEWDDKKPYNCYLLKETDEKIDADINITITGRVTTAECKMVQQGKNEKLSYWANGCKYQSIEELHEYVYSRANTFRELPPCTLPTEPLDPPFGPYLGEVLDAEVPEGYELVEEKITDVKTGTFPAYDGFSTVYTNVREPTNGDDSIFCYSMVSAFAWSVDVYSGVLETKYFTRTYRPVKE